jgi:iron complex outermembrane receptor protein
MKSLLKSCAACKFKISIHNIRFLLTAVFLLSISIQQAYSQAVLLDKKIRMNAGPVSLENALDQIADQAGCTFSYTSSAIDSDRMVSFKNEEITLANALKLLFGNQLQKMEVQGNKLLLIFNEKHGDVKGKVRTADGPAAFVTVGIKGLKLTQTNANGDFLLKEVPEGNHSLLFAAIGFKSQVKRITVQAGNTFNINVVMEADEQVLQQVEVTGRKSVGYKSDYSFSSTKTQMAIKDIPQTISTVTKELIQDKQALRLNDIVQNIAGVTQFSVYDDISIRGFRSSRGNNRLLNGMRLSNNWLSPLLVNIERVEVIKGPASAIFANTRPGGTVNMVTKKPLDERRQSVDFSLGSYNTLRAQADFTGPLDSAHTLLYRLNLGYEDGESFRNQIFNKNYLIAPSISFLPKPGTRFNADLIYGDIHTILDRGHTAFQNDKSLYSTPISLNANQPGDYLKNKAVSINFSFSQEINANHTFNASYMVSKLDELNNEHTIEDYITQDSTLLSFSDKRIKMNSKGLNLYMNSKFITGKLAHQVLYGYDYNSAYFIDQSRTAIGGADGVKGFSLRNPVYFNRPVNNYIFREESGYTSLTESQTHGIYLQDVIRYKKLQVLISLRQEFYKIPKSNYNKSLIQSDQKQNALLPRIGITYGLTDQINIYGTYNTGFEPQNSDVLGTGRNGGPFKPLESELFEAGAKGEFFSKKLFAGLSVYQITQNNVLVNANDITNPDLLRERGEERARGIELEATGNVMSNLSVSLSYAYNLAKITKDSQEENIGKIKEGAARHISGSWIKYSLRKGILNGLGISLGHSQVGKRNTFLKELQLPGYLIFNAGLSYQVERFRLAGNLYNLTNKTYFVGGYNYERNFPGTPRNFMLSAGYTF